MRGQKCREHRHADATAHGRALAGEIAGGGGADVLDDGFEDLYLSRVDPPAHPITLWNRPCLSG
jgi:hypothetical protein